MTINALKVTILCGLNIPHLYSNYVSKQKEQNIVISRLDQVKARTVTIKGRLNALKLPNDVVLANTDDFIPLLNISSSIDLNSDLNTHGAIDGIELKYLVENRVTLSSSETVVSKLVFLNDICIKDLVIKGLVNGIALSNAVKTTGENIIKGPKKFQRNLILISDLLASGSVNHISELDSLFMDISLKDEESSISNMVNFTGIETSDLMVERINNISLDNLWNVVDGAEIKFLELLIDFSKKNWDKSEILLKIRNEIAETSPFYGFFELHQVLRYPTTQFLPIFESGISGENYELPVNKIVVWINLNKTCKLFRSRMMDVSPNGTLTNQISVQGRVFPLALSGEEEDIELFAVHTDTSKSCINVGYTSLETVFKNGNRTKFPLQPPTNSTVLQARLFQSDNSTFILMAFTFVNGNGTRMFLYRYNRNDGNWVVHDKFHEFDVSSFDVILSVIPHQGIHLAVTNAGEHPGIHYYTWNSDLKFGLQSVYTKSVSTAAMWIHVNEAIFLLLSKEKTTDKKEYNRVFVYTEPIEVHILTENGFLLDHSINIKGISSFEKFVFEDETYVLAVSQHFQVIHVLQYRGYNGFEVIQKIDAPGVVGTTIFSSTNFDILLAISSSTGHTRILKLAARGM